MEILNYQNPHAKKGKLYGKLSAESYQIIVIDNDVFIYSENRWQNLVGKFLLEHKDDPLYKDLYEKYDKLRREVLVRRALCE